MGEIGSNMRSVVVPEYNKPLEIQEVPRPTPRNSEILVKITACSLCMSDIFGFMGHVPTAQTPYCPGHEPVGIVENIGSAVTGFKVGDRVGWMPAARSCQACTECISGQHRYCKNRVNIGFDPRSGCGGFSQYCVADPLSTVKIPERLSDNEAAPLLCAGVTAYGAIKKVSHYLPGGSKLNIIGCGGVGHIAIQYAAKMGYHVTAYDIAQDKLDLAIKCGAKEALNSTMVKEMDIIKTGATVVISAAAPAYDFAIKCTATGGKIIAIGVPHGAVPINIMQMIFDEISIITTNQGSKIELIEALQIAADLDVKPIYEVKPMSKINDGVADMLAGKIVGRVVYHWN